MSKVISRRLRMIVLAGALTLWEHGMTMAQTAAPAACDCETAFRYVRHELETNYAGFADKVNSKTRKSYDSLVRKTLAKVKKPAHPAYCEYALRDFAAFFHDGHVQVYDPREPDMNDTAAISARIRQCEVIKLDPARLASLEHSPAHEEGIYYYGDSTYKIAIIKSKNEFRDYAGVIIDSKVPVWKPGEVKLELRKHNDSLYDAILYLRDHSALPQLYAFNGATFDGGNWNKVGKMQAHRDNGMFSRFGFKRIQVQKLSDSTLYIQIGTFGMSNYKAIDSMFKANEHLLKTMPYLVLDVRRNGGGGDAAYGPILPYIYTNPIVGDGNDVYATPDNIRRWQHDLDKDTDLPESSKNDIREMIGRMKAHAGSFVLSADDDTLETDRVEPYPRKIVVLTERHCASSTEQFLLAARQSTKVTLMGEHTYGELDYSNWLVAESPCNNIEMHYSTTRSSRIKKGTGIDGKGIVPDIRLDHTQDWIAEAQKFLETGRTDGKHK